MKVEKITTEWIDNMSFESQVNGHKITLDADEAVGGLDKGARPKPLMMVALAGCTAMDVISILKKMKVEVDDFKIHIEAEMTEDHPKHYVSMHLIYEFSGIDLSENKIKKAVSLSQDKYCGVSYMYKKIMDITHEIIIKNKQIM